MFFFTSMPIMYITDVFLAPVCLANDLSICVINYAILWFVIVAGPMRSVKTDFVFNVSRETILHNRKIAGWIVLLYNYHFD